MTGFRVGLRLADVAGAARFYAGLGFDRVGAIPGPEGGEVMVILRRGESQLIVDALVGMPFRQDERERRIQEGPRGLGVALGMHVPDLAACERYCRAAGCVITAEAADQPWGDRVFECLDPFGYLWEFSAGIADEHGTAEALRATGAAWFGDDNH